MGRAEKRRELRKNRQIKEKEEVLDTSIHGLTVLKLVSFVVILLLIIYYILAVFVTKELDISNGKDKGSDTTSAEVSKKILAANIFNQSEETYYVYCYDFNGDEDFDGIDSAVNSAKYPVYKVDTGNGINSNYVGEVDNPNAKTLEELKLKSPTLLLITNDTISAYYNNKADIIRVLGE